jgi:hypothetical protein
MYKERDFIKTSEVCKLYGINSYFLKKLNIQKYKTSETSRTPCFYRVADVNNAISAWNEKLLNSVIKKNETNK